MDENNKDFSFMGVSNEEINKTLVSWGVSLDEINKTLVSWGVSLDEVVQKIASLGLPGIVLVIAVAASGSTCNPLIFVLAGLGGPLGILGGLGGLGLMTIVGDVVTGYGIEALLSAIYKERRKTETQESLLKEVEGLPIKQGLKLNLKHQLEVEIASEAPASPRNVEIVEVEE
jgi:hypothetical protein